MKFANPSYFLLLFGLIPYAFFLFLRYRKAEKRRRADFSAEAIKELYPSRSIAAFFVRNLFMLAALLFALIALTNPYTRESLISAPRPVKDVMIALDVSLSMNARDVFPSRFEAARRELLQVLKVPNLRASLLLFSGKTLLTLPFTQDRQALSLFAQELQPGYIRSEGTNYQALFETIIEEYDHSLSLSKELGWITSRAPTHVIVLTDGDGIEWPEEPLFYEMRKRDIILWVEAFGSVEGAAIPLYNENGEFTDYLTLNGVRYHSKNQEALLRNWVESTRGYYVSYSTTERLSEKVFQIQDKMGTDAVFQDYLAIKNTVFPAFLALAILSLLIGMVL
ncbi:MAG TPA: VWA domain-containing protein [Thermotogota bacterium]|jgi:Ca-activated chloride channel family protein|nr:VWA domain-containing protein [Thermotogota bacterium]NLH18858.1 VWA domain-containing protein [Thermotogaceae bacterium]OQC30440.1 MAG: von Willebrand factor type A domain protein [Thermotogota bacterium ADurb.Bin062]HNW46686.1 VWA domain-containing protein [Thermotogota bacterium]HNY81235.1 VWA domain-containing protein [Thermotogota bacterium]